MTYADTLCRLRKRQYDSVMSSSLIIIGLFVIVPLVIGGAVLISKKSDDPGAPTRNASAGSAWGTKKVADRRAMYGRRYGAGAAWTAGAWTAGTWTATGGLNAPQNDDGVDDPNASCGGAGCAGGAGRGGGGGCGGS